MNLFHTPYLITFVIALHIATCVSIFPWSQSVPELKFPKLRNPNFTLPYQTCSVETYGIMEDVVVNPCLGENVCQLIRGTNVQLILTFKATFPAVKVLGSLAGVIFAGLLPIKFGRPENMCQQIKCPLIPGEIYNYTTTVLVRHQFPKMRLNTRVLIQGDDHDIACALIPVEIVDPIIPMGVPVGPQSLRTVMGA